MKPLVRNIQICSQQADLNFHIFPIVCNQGFKLKDTENGETDQQYRCPKCVRGDINTDGI